MDLFEPEKLDTHWSLYLEFCRQEFAPLRAIRALHFNVLQHHAQLPASQQRRKIYVQLYECAARLIRSRLMSPDTSQPLLDLNDEMALVTSLLDEDKTLASYPVEYLATLAQHVLKNYAYAIAIGQGNALPDHLYTWSKALFEVSSTLGLAPESVVAGQYARIHIYRHWSNKDSWLNITESYVGYLSHRRLADELGLLDPALAQEAMDIDRAREPYLRHYVHGVRSHLRGRAEQIWPSRLRQ